MEKEDEDEFYYESGHSNDIDDLKSNTVSLSFITESAVSKSEDWNVSSTNLRMIAMSKVMNQ
jgi:hypothetical protein